MQPGAVLQPNIMAVKGLQDAGHLYATVMFVGSSYLGDRLRNKV